MSLLILQYENLLYTKDMQLLNLENKLKHAKEELNKIVNTKVFSRGNNLIYELDVATRQQRMMKDNIFAVEKGIKDKTRLYFDKDLEQTRVLLAEQKKKFKEYQNTLNAHIKLDVKNNINYIDEVMRERVEQYKDTQNAVDGKTKQIEKVASLTDKYAHLVKKGPSNDPNDPFGGSNQNNLLIFAEMERLKESESESREEVLKLQNFIRKQRTIQSLKMTVQKQ